MFYSLIPLRPILHSKTGIQSYCSHHQKFHSSIYHLTFKSPEAWFTTLQPIPPEHFLLSSLLLSPTGLLPWRKELGVHKQETNKAGESVLQAIAKDETPSDPLFTSFLQAYMKHQVTQQRKWQVRQKIMKKDAAIPCFCPYQLQHTVELPYKQR